MKKKHIIFFEDLKDEKTNINWKADIKYEVIGETKRYYFFDKIKATDQSTKEENEFTFGVPKKDEGKIYKIAHEVIEEKSNYTTKSNNK